MHTAMTKPIKVRKRPVEVEAIQWTLDNEIEIEEFCNGTEFSILSDTGRLYCDDPDATAEVYDRLHSTWVLVHENDWIIKGTEGEFYPCKPEVFEKVYEKITFDGPFVVSVNTYTAEYRWTCEVHNVPMRMYGMTEKNGLITAQEHLCMYHPDHIYGILVLPMDMSWPLKDEVLR